MKKLIFVLMLAAVANFAFGSNLNAEGEQPAVVNEPIKILKSPIPKKLNSGESKPSEVPSRNAEVCTKGWELTLHIKGTHAEGDFKIVTKKDFSRRDLERGIFILELKQNSSGDRILYFEYKESRLTPDMWHFFSEYRRIKRIDNATMKEDRFIPFDFTYYELINAVEKLVYTDKLILAGDTIAVKERVFKKLPDDIFTISSFRPRPPY
jgi:hypothetical protein